ncbi:MAG: HDOD domain-containing protein [Gammaproteobacteria bacterium]|nr:HDOD domain-containing protein [Gammaproteobacteria bacterium]
MSDVYVGRQPIYNKSLGVYGYELLFRAGEENAAAMGELSADGATSTTIINSFLEIGLDKLVGTRQAFINLTEQFLIDENALPISPQQVVLEILEDIPITAKLIKSVERLKAAGFTIALDDYIYNPAHKPIVSLVDIIKIDIMQLNQKELITHVKVLKKYNALLLAEKVETMEEFEFCRELGFDYFQGYFLSRPRIIKSKKMPSNKLAVLNLLSVLNNAKAEVEDLEEAISFDVSMSYKMLKLINSPFFGFRNKVNSIKHAIVILGRNQLRSWASMIAMSKLDDRPSEMIHIAMTRGKMCELLAEQANLGSVETYFTAGMFSALDILMERKINSLIEPLPLSNDVVAALLKREGKMGEAINCALAYEMSQPETAQFAELSSNDMFVAHIEAITWANMVVDTL